MGVKDFVDFGTCDSELELRTKIIQPLVKRGKLNVKQIDGKRRPEKRYTHNWECSKLAHDELLKKIVLEVLPDRFTCRQVNPDVLPDSEWWFGDEHYFVELHITMSIKTIESVRLPKYRQFAPGAPVLWIIHEDTENLMERNLEAMLARRWGPNHLFTTSTKILADPYGAILEFIDAEGDRCITCLPDSADVASA